MYKFSLHILDQTPLERPDHDNFTTKRIKCDWWLELFNWWASVNALPSGFEIIFEVLQITGLSVKNI